MISYAPERYCRQKECAPAFRNELRNSSKLVRFACKWAWAARFWGALRMKIFSHYSSRRSEYIVFPAFRAKKGDSGKEKVKMKRLAIWLTAMLTAAVLSPLNAA